MTVGELRSKIAGVPPTLPVVIETVAGYIPCVARWQNGIHISFARDASLDEAARGEVTQALVVCSTT